MLSTSQHVNFDSCAILENFCHTFSGSVLNLCRAPWPWRLIKTTFHFQPSTHDLLKLHRRVFLTNAINLTKGRLDAGDCPKMGGMFQKITILINLILKHMMVNHEVWVYPGAPYQETTHVAQHITTYIARPLDGPSGHPRRRPRCTMSLLSAILLMLLADGNRNRVTMVNSWCF